MDFFTICCIFGMVIGLGISFYPALLKYREFRKLRAEIEAEKHKQ